MTISTLTPPTEAPLGTQPAAPPGIYYLTQDTRAIAETLTGSCTDLSPVQRQDVRAVADELWEEIERSIRQLSRNVMTFTEETIQQGLTTTLEEEIGSSDSVALCLDKYFLPSEKMSAAPLRGLQISRMADGSKAPRQGSQPIDAQLDRLSQEINGRPVVVVDDGIFTGGSIRYVLGLLQERRIQIKSIVVFMGNPAVRQVNGIDVRRVRSLDNCIDWIDARDLTILGGRPEKLSSRLSVASSRPYIAPFSDGRPASIEPRSLRKTSGEILGAQESFFRELETIIGKKITLRDSLRAGFPLPVCEDPALRTVGLSTPLREIALRARQTLDTQAMPSGDIILDMDGTLYSLDGPGNGFVGSTLEREVNRNAVAFIMKREPCTEQNALKIFTEGSRDFIGLSAFLSRRYSITRDSYYDEVWGTIDVTAIVQRSKAIAVVRELQASGKVLRLLTSAPSAWAQKVLEYLGVQNCFASITTGEQFGQKAEVFETYRNSPDVQNMLSVGDQFHSDIQPAIDAGMQTLQVSFGRSVTYLLSLQ